MKKDNSEQNETKDFFEQEREQFLSILDSIPELIYVATIDTYETLFANKKIKEVFGEDITGKKCYEALQGKNQPCEFCTNKHIQNSSEPYFWNYYNPKVEKHFYIMDRKIKWLDRKEARFELAIDVTEQKNNELKIQSSEKILRIAFESANIGIMYVDKDGKVLYANKECSNIFGYSSEEFKTMTVNDFTVPQDKNISPRFMKTALENESLEKADFVKRYYHKNGNIITCEISSTLLHDVDGEPLHFISHIKDVTKHKKAEEDLRKNEEKYRLLTENVSDVIWVLNLTKEKFSYISPTVFQLRGYTAEEAMRQDISQSLTPESAKEVADAINKFLPRFLENPEAMSQVIHRHELRQPCRDGSIIWVETTTRYQLNSNNEIEVIGVSRNIDERKKQQERLANRLRYEENIAMFSNTLLLDKPNAVNRSLQYIMKASNCSRVYIFENFIDENKRLAMKQTHEVCAKDVSSQNDNPELQHVVYQRDGFERWREILSRNGIINEIVAELPQCERDMLEPQNIKSILAIPIWSSQKWFGFIGFDNTVSAKKWTNEDIDLLRAASEILGLYIENQSRKNKLIHSNKELREAVATKDRFISILGHDLKNPFISILGFSDLLLENIDQYDSEKIKELVSSIDNSAKQTYSLLNNLLEWSRIQRNKTPFNPEPSNLYYLIQESYLLVKSSADGKNIRIAIDAPKQIEAVVDEEMIKTALRNLLNNAIKFTPQNGYISISAKKTSASVIIIVSDTGIGMSDKTKNSLFKIGETQSINGTNGEEGTGFGLLLCKEFIDKHSGAISVESELGKGSRFIVTLPT